jgi:lipopolysaccharide biosynthesis protein
VLIAQAHSPEDDLSFIAHVARYLRDPRYLRVDGRPLLLVYRPGQLPDPAASAARWRAWCRDNGIGEICIGYAQSFERPDPRDIGFDVAVEFPPNLSTPGNITAGQRLLNPDYSGEVLDWREMARDYSQRPMPDYRLFPGVNCGWDNEPRRGGRGRTYLHASPRRYREWLSATIFERLAGVPERDRLVFLNAWNEWAEGAVLEPDARTGYSWLEATRSAMRQHALPQRMSGPCLAIHAWYPDVLRELLDKIQASAIDWHLFVTTSPEKESAVRGILTEAGARAEVMVYENRGRDILPFLGLAKELERRGYEGVILKVHTKRSAHRADGEAWRRDLLDPLLDRDNASRILDAFSRQPDLGMVAPAKHLLETAQFQGANAPATAFLRRLLGLHHEPHAGEIFASGSMYYLRLTAIRDLLDADIEIDQFEKESGQIDGTLAHAVERVIASVVQNAGFNLLGAGVAGDLAAPAAVHSYPFATRT